MVPLKKKVLGTATLVLGLIGSSCATERNPSEVFNELAEPFVYNALALTPIAATAMGYHEHTAAGGTGAAVALDELLDDYSAEGIAARIKFYRDFRNTLHEQVQRDRLAGSEWADYAVVENQIDRELFDLEKAKSHEHNPTLYVELVGNALFAPLALEYAPTEDRYRHILARLEKLPAFLDQAKKNLQSSPAVWTEVAREENDGNIRLVERVIPAGLPDSLRSRYEQVSPPALQALRDFNTYLSSDLAKRSSFDWRLGSQLYDEKFKIWLTTSKSPADMLAEAEADLQTTQNEIVETARPIHRKIYGNQRPPTDYALMKDVLDVVSDDNRLRRGDQLIGQVKEDVQELRSFITQAALVPLPPRDNLQVIETPEFMRGVYSVAGFMGAPPLQPELNAYYWVTPIPPDWPSARINSKLREYNLFKLDLLSIHEVMPGHYVQSELANEGLPDELRYRRILRAVFANGPYVEGWASYITRSTVNAGFSNRPEFRLNWLKELLKIQANTILDIRMHTGNMSDADAEELLTRRAFQESEEVRGKILRAKLSSAQLPLYYHGMKQWLRVREHYQQETTDFSLSSFHDKALRTGAVPLEELAYLVANRRPMSD